MSPSVQSKYWLQEEPLSLDDVYQLVIRPEAGAVATFIGIARKFTHGKQTSFLQYEAYVPMAEKKLEEIGREINKKWPNSQVAIAHRIGRLDISDIAVAIAVSTPHRDAAFKASRYAIERIKEMVPIWKKEYWVDGSEWIGNQQETVSFNEKPAFKGGSSHD